jgi:hypothetical protein
MRMQQMTTPRATPAGDEYETSDLGIAAFCLALDLPLLRVEQGERVRFIFPGSAEDTARLFYMPGRNLVDARKFHISLRELRGLTRAEGRR